MLHIRYTYGIEHEADFTAKNIKSDASGVAYTLVTPNHTEEIFIPVPGKFTVYNTLAVIAACEMLGIDKEDYLNSLRNTGGVAGRFETVPNDNPGKFTVYNTLAVIAACEMLGIDKEDYLNSLRNTGGVAGRFETVPNDKGISVIVDYAHTPDALENVLNTAREFVEGDLVAVFGCGGDRDSEKRPLMGGIGQRLSDRCIINNDNPRTEDPELILKDILLIIKDILAGLDESNENYKVVMDRKEAIKEAIESAKKGDVILIAGKGHENYQILGTVKHHFDDKEVAREVLDSLK